MEFLKDTGRLSFQYGEKHWLAHQPSVTYQERENERITTYLFPDGLKVTNRAKKYEAWNAWEWFNELENTGDANTEIISELWDCDCVLPLSHKEKRPPSPWTPSKETETYVLNPRGSTSVDEYDFYTHLTDCCKYTSFLLPLRASKTPQAQERIYSSFGGRSSDGDAPYFNIHENGRGYFVAVGWTGQWNARLFRESDGVRVQSKIEDTCFYLKPHEKIRTSSVLILPYTCSVEDSFNLWRRFLRAEISPVKEGCDALPLALGIWGGTPSDEYIRRVDFAKGACGIPFNYVWMDAGWCGIDTEPTRNEYSGDWAEHVGDFRVSPKVHPNGLQDVADRVHAHGMKFVLWFEPERVRKSVELVREHPEYLLFDKDEANQNCLMNLDHPEAFSYCLETISALIERLGVDFYRQDFNIRPLAIWRANDEPNRRGLTEIKCITGIWRLWDALRARFPHLLIDNCASGGKRLDIEMMKRSVALWRSDAQCPVDPIPEVTQANHMNFSLWMPYGGTGSGRVYDTYRMRSAYATSLSTTYSYSADEHFGETEEQIVWLRERCEEYLRIRPYFDGDIYHLTAPLRDDTSWCAIQWDRPEVGDGLIQVFKREKSPYTDASLTLRKINAEARYRITDIDGGSWEIDGKELIERGFCLHIEEKRVAKLYLYERIEG